MTELSFKHKKELAQKLEDSKTFYQLICEELESQKGYDEISI